MAITIPSGFRITSKDPIDTRITVADANARLGFSVVNVYEGLVVYQQDNNQLYVLTDAAAPTSASSWASITTTATAVEPYRIVTGSVTASVNVENSIFLLQSGSYDVFNITNQGQTTISGSADTMFIIKNENNIFEVSQSGVIILATSSIELSGSAPVGGMYFTNTAFFIGLEN